MSTTHTILITKTLNLPKNSVENTIKLLDDGATIPFIARYRKEMTGSLDEVAIGDINNHLKKLRELEKRKETILKAIEEQGALTDKIKTRIQNTWDSTVLEDIYLPFKKKRKTRGAVAKAKGLEPLATLLSQQKIQHIESEAKKFLNEEVPSLEDALAGARDIIAEWVNENEAARNKVRYIFKKEATIKAKVARGKQETGIKYKDYFDFEEPLKRCPAHRLMAIRRGEEEGFLRVSIKPEEEEVLYKLDQLFVEGNGPASKEVKVAVQDSYKRLIQPSIETEFRNTTKELADKEAIGVFAENLKQLLLAPPLGELRTLALDPGFRTGCKIVCLDENGYLLQNTTIYPHPPQTDRIGSTNALKKLVQQYNIQAIAIGNGTAGRESMSLVKEIDFGRSVEVYMVNENGASIYSASATAREEFPDQDVTVRGAVSIGRRLMDPLAELVKIDAKSIGVGQYQHDVHQGMLKESLDRVVESCVNAVGVNVNTASKHLLTYVSGLGPTLANNVVQFRKENGAFTNRKQLKKVARMGAKSFEQCAGFLRIKDAKNPLDNTAVHPESYSIVEQMAKDLNCSVKELISNKSLHKELELKNYITDTIGLPTLKDILKELDKPGLDPRGKAKSFEFAKNIKTINDLSEGMVLPGLVTNITNFGAFVDIGVKQDGLVHVSQIANKFVKNPADEVKLQQQVKVKILEIDIARNRILLSMKQV